MKRELCSKCGVRKAACTKAYCPWISAAHAPITWPRADPVLLAAFNPATKQCTMSCGPSRDDPRTDAERKFLCDECLPMEVQGHDPLAEALAAINAAWMAVPLRFRKTDAKGANGVALHEAIRAMARALQGAGSHES